MDRIFLIVAGLLGCSSVAIGAVVAHALAPKIDREALESLLTAVRYQQLHALLLVGIALLVRFWPSAWWTYAGLAIVLGVLLFSGGIYLTRLADVPWGAKIAPFGGTMLMVGWLLLAIGGWRSL
jgi:uncharacterized membrane protein YgdD (TMEM256/DUF423 family)